MDRQRFRILVVDDDPIARDVVYSILSREGYTVFSAKDGFEAIDILRKQSLDLMITDLIMPAIDGIELIKSALKINPGLATVIITAYGTLDSALKAIEHGAYDYMTKPFKIEEMLFLVERCKRMINLNQENKLLKKILLDIFNKDLLDTERIDIDLINMIEDVNIFTDAEIKVYKKIMESSHGKT